MSLFNEGLFEYFNRCDLKIVFSLYPSNNYYLNMIEKENSVVSIRNQMWLELLHGNMILFKILKKRKNSNSEIKKMD